MATSITVAELLVEIGVDASDAEKAAAKLGKSLRRTGDDAKKLGKDVKLTEKRIAKFKETAARAEKFARALSKALKIAAGTIVAIGTGVIKTGSDFETLSARLKTVTGSAERAEDALSFVKDFAKDTPFQVGEITDAFIKLRNLGIEPTERRLTAFGNIAAGNSKSLDQFTEAVLDASSGEFERLKEFGIRASQSGDQVALTFRGVTTSIGNNAADITDFLTNIGENEFAGAMAERMGTLEGVISNAKDAFTNFLLEVAQDGPLQEFKNLIGDLVKGAGDKEGLAKILSRTLVTAIRGLRKLLASDFIEILKTGAKALEFVIDNWKIFIGLIAGAKTVQAFNLAAAGFTKMGFAASGALGPIGLIAGALIALIPLANEVGSAIGEAIPGFIRGKDIGQKKRSKAQAAFGDIDPQAVAQIKELDAQFAALEASGAGIAPLGRKRLQSLSNARDNVLKSAQDAARARRRIGEDVSGREEFAEAAFFAGEEAEILSTQFGPQLSRAAQAEIDRPTRRGRGGRAKAKKKRPTSIDTVSQFFRAAQAGDVGAIAARTPSTKDIEPTVAVDITNNNFTFDNKITVKSTAPGAEVAREVAMAIRTEFQGRLASAGQQLASNIVR